MPGFSGYLHQLVTYEEPTFKITPLWLKKTDFGIFNGLPLAKGG